MIRRTLESELLRLSRKFPVVTLTGPRQSGKTTLCRMAFPEKAYVSLEAPDVREYARTDPRGFLQDHSRGAILDEIQRTPDLLSYLQVEVDREPKRGRFILTGSANLALLQSISQSLAGRTALVNLLPLGLEERRRFPKVSGDLFETLRQGAYPAIFDRELDSADWFAGYVGTYVERDVRQILNVGDLTAFQTFLGLCAGRTAQLLNLSNLAADVGITHNTARSWISVLEAGYVTFRLPPFHANWTKRSVKTPKLHFYDSGLVCYLLGIRNAGQLRSHPMRGAIFESWVVSEILKARLHRGQPANLFFFRDRKGDEVDLVVQRESGIVAVEMKSAATAAEDFFQTLRRFCSHDVRPRGRTEKPMLVYGGDRIEERSDVRVLPWSSLPDCDWG